VNLFDIILFIFQFRLCKYFRRIKSAHDVHDLSIHPADCVEKTAAGLAISFESKLNLFSTDVQKHEFIRQTMSTLRASVVPYGRQSGSEFRLATVHALKGFETDKIFLCSDLAEFHDDSGKAIDTVAQLELCVFYVALSRTTKVLLIPEQYEPLFGNDYVTHTSATNTPDASHNTGMAQNAILLTSSENSTENVTLVNPMSNGDDEHPKRRRVET